MARKKEPQRIEINRGRIIEAAKQLFFEQGIAYVKIDDIAKKAKMSKSTLYVYFKSKDEIVNCIFLEAMMQFYEKIKTEFTRSDEKIYNVYKKICYALLEMRNEYPMNFDMIIQEIPVDSQMLEEDNILKQIFEIGENINALVMNKIGEIFPNISEKEKKQRIFEIWGELYGLITLSANKKTYMEKYLGISQSQYLEQGFDNLFDSLLC